MEQLKELKAQAYDLIVRIEEHQIAIQQLSEELKKVNHEIQKELSLEASERTI